MRFNTQFEWTKVLSQLVLHTEEIASFSCDTKNTWIYFLSTLSANVFKIESCTSFYWTQKHRPHFWQLPFPFLQVLGKCPTKFSLSDNLAFTKFCQFTHFWHFQHFSPKPAQIFVLFKKKNILKILIIVWQSKFKKKTILFISKCFCLS